METSYRSLHFCLLSNVGICLIVCWLMMCLFVDCGVCSFMGVLGGVCLCTCLSGCLSGGLGCCGMCLFVRVLGLVDWLFLLLLLAAATFFG